MKHPKISALAITLNEAENLPRFLENLAFVDEIVIVDSFSTDATVSIAEGFENVTLYQREFDNFSAQKNFAIDQASHDWILFFDPDEDINTEVQQEIVHILKNPKNDAYSIRRQLYFMGKKIQYSGFQTDWVIRVFKKGVAQYNGNLVHETLSVQGSVGKMKTRVPHYTYKSFDDYMHKLDRYSALQAQMLFNKGKKANLLHFLFRPAYRFWHQYLIRLGILDGKEGFILAYINAFSVFRRYVNLRLLHRKMR